MLIRLLAALVNVGGTLALAGTGVLLLVKGTTP